MIQDKATPTIYKLERFYDNIKGCFGKQNNPFVEEKKQETTLLVVVDGQQVKPQKIAANSAETKVNIMAER